MTPPRRAVSILVACGLLVAPGAAAADAIDRAASCGEWRWPVKTLSDPRRFDVDLTSRDVTVERLRSLDPPSSLTPRTRRVGPVEERVYRIEAQVVAGKIQEDSDIHLVIAIRRHLKKTMIVEFPDPACVESPFKRTRMRAARRSILRRCGRLSRAAFTDLRGRVTLRGVGFWDEIHGQTGVAPNGIELHPVLGFSGRCRAR